MVCDCGEYDEGCLTCAHCQVAVCTSCQDLFFEEVWEAEIDERVSLYVLCRSCTTVEWSFDA